MPYCDGQPSQLFSSILAASDIRNPGFLKLFGPQTLDGDPAQLSGGFSDSLTLSVVENAVIKAPCDCGITVVRNPETNIEYLALDLYARRTLDAIRDVGLINEKPSFILIKKDDLIFRGLEEGDYIGFLDDYVNEPPRRGLEGGDLAGEVYLRVMAGKTDIFFLSGCEIGRTRRQSMEIKVLTIPQIRSLDDSVGTATNNIFWPEIERRNVMDPLVFLNALVRAQEEYSLSIFKDSSNLNDTKYWFANTSRTPKRIIVEVRSEHNIPLSELDENAPWIELRAAPGRFSSFSGAAERQRVSQSIGGFFLINMEQTSLRLVSIRSSDTVVIPPVNEQFVFWVGNLASDQVFVDESDVIGGSKQAPVHWVIQALRPADWFSPQQAQSTAAFVENKPEAATRLIRYTTGNQVNLLIDGIEYFSSLQDSLEELEASNDEHFFHFSAWSISVDFKLISELYTRYRAYTLKEILDNNNIVSSVRALIWDNIVPHPEPPWLPRTNYSVLPAVDFINGFNYGNPDDITIIPITTPVRAILDDRQGITSFSANHMKIAVVQSGTQSDMIAYCGGIDIWPDRVTSFQHHESAEKPFRAVPPLPFVGSIPYQAPGGLHDTMVQVKGEAANQLNLVLYKRWADAEMNNVPDRTPNKLPFTYSRYEGSNNEGTVLIQVAMTIDARPTPTYGFASEGDTTLFNTLRYAIKSARQFIYVEDQYLRDPNIINELGNAAERGVTVIILMDALNWDSQEPAGMPEDYYASYSKIWNIFHPSDPIPVIEQVPTAKEQTNPFRTSYPDNFSVFSIKAKSEYIYVHSKLVIVDDIFLSCGSANIDRLGMGTAPNGLSSCECNLFCIDASCGKDGTRKMVQESRIRLWAEHLFGQHYLDDSTNARGRLTQTYKEALRDPLSAFKLFWQSSLQERVIRLN